MRTSKVSIALNVSLSICGYDKLCDTDKLLVIYQYQHKCVKLLFLSTCYENRFQLIPFLDSTLAFLKKRKQKQI